MSLLCLLLTAVFTIESRAQNFVYTNNDGFPNSVSAFSVAANGALTQIPGSPFLTGGLGLGGGLFAANRITIRAASNFLFVSNDGSGSISVFSINPLTGALTAVPGSPFALGVGGDITLAVSPDNKFLFAGSDSSDAITSFSIATDGALTPVAGSPVAVGGDPNGIRVSPNGKFLYVVITEIPGFVAVFSIAANGALAPIPGSPFPPGGVSFLAGLDINCFGNLLFSGVATFGPAAVEVFNVAPNGVPSRIPGSPFTFPGASNSNVSLLSPDERFLFVSNQYTNNDIGSITVLNVAANGSLTQIPGSPFANPGGVYPSGMATNRTGTLLYAANFNNTVSVFSIAANGALTPVPGSPFPTGVPGGLLSLTAYPPKGCGPAFDLCIQDDSSKNILGINTATGEYQLTNCFGLNIGGRGFVTRMGNTITLQHNAVDRRVFAKIDLSVKRANASVQSFSLNRTFTIGDRNTADSSCGCN